MLSQLQSRPIITFLFNNCAPVDGFKVNDSTFNSINYQETNETIIALNQIEFESISEPCSEIGIEADFPGTLCTQMYIDINQGLNSSSGLDPESPLKDPADAIRNINTLMSHPDLLDIRKIIILNFYGSGPCHYPAKPTGS